MRKTGDILRWVGVVFLGLIMAILEDLMYLQVLVPYLPISWDLTGNLFFTFTVPFAQLMALAITGSLAWFFLGLRERAKLITFWATWSIARAAFLFAINNPLEDVLIYLVWIAFWCGLLGLLARRAVDRPAEQQA